MIIVVRAQRCTRQCLRDYIFLPQLCFCLETERKFTDVGYDNIKKDCKIHISKILFEKNNFAKNDLQTP